MHRKRVADFVNKIFSVFLKKLFWRGVGKADGNVFGFCSKVIEYPCSVCMNCNWIFLQFKSAAFRLRKCIPPCCYVQIRLGVWRWISVASSFEIFALENFAAHFDHNFLNWAMPIQFIRVVCAFHFRKIRQIVIFARIRCMAKIWCLTIGYCWCTCLLAFWMYL